MNAIVETIKNFVLNTLGHAVSGAGVGVIYELQKIVLTAGFDWQTVLFSVTVGGCIGFFKTVVEELEKLMANKSTAVGSKTGRSYFGL